MRSLLLLLLMLCSLHVSRAQAQTDTVNTTVLNKRKLHTAIATSAGFYAAGISYLRFVWYKDHERVPFHYYNDAAGYLQIDKFGHAWGAYLESYIGYHWLRSAGLSRNKSLVWGGGLGFILQAPIEVFDGMYEGWGFSWSDMAANAAGSGIVIGNELLFKEQLVKYKFSFAPSPYREQAHGYLGDTALESLFLDYNAHTYWLSMPLKELLQQRRLPPWLNLAAGYSANGMYGEFKNRSYYRGQAIPPAERYRQFLLSADVDWTRIPTNSRFLKTLFKGMVFIKLPFPALEVNSTGAFKLHGLYY
ncbi:DUF2279 domain-containing protein [Cesiribacter sp. SM1]|uniref:DUF2279 domain-containing protein n=1 Tax=Cesiribacter sp. SM1 TaxID=2861196 RepID=UPI001CD7B551|nr:DUF2279 domain-containing protein [Cesiribacter sp. SM1]